MSTEEPEDVQPRRFVQRLKDPEHRVYALGDLDGLSVVQSDEGPVLFVLGTARSCAVRITDEKYEDGLARAGVEIAARIDEYGSDGQEADE